MKIGIVGNGVVGNATGKALEPHVDGVWYYDMKLEKSTSSLTDVLDHCDMLFVCLPTPQDQRSLACNTNIVEEFLQFCSPGWEDQNIVLRSTVPVGFTRHMREKYVLVNLVHSPEFLTARTAEYDAANPTRLLIGDPGYIRIHDSEEMSVCCKVLRDLYASAFDFGRRPTYPRIFTMTSDESEFVKLMQNVFSAVKVAFFNEMRCFSDKKELDWERCMAALLAGGWINPMHTQVPGPDGKRGFGGSCLPKDLKNLIQCGLNADVAMLLCNAASIRNVSDREQR